MVDVSVHSLTVGEYLETWLAGKHALMTNSKGSGAACCVC